MSEPRETVEVSPQEKALLKIARDVTMRGHGSVLLEIRDGKFQHANEVVKHKF
jgi:hypothetical protein